MIHIDQIVNSDLCTGCGTCIGICPTNSLTLTLDKPMGVYIPKLDKSSCTRCGICSSCCPGLGVDFKELNSIIFGESKQYNPLIGHYKGTYISNSKDRYLRWKASSGGLVTTLLIFAFRQKIIDCALLVKMDDTNPLYPHVYIARTEQEIILAQGSKYCPVPMNTGLKEILKSDKKCAVVGLPCHIHGIRKAEKRNARLRKLIVLHLGIFCSHTVNFRGTEFLLDRIGVKKETVSEIKYRGNGWPGDICVKLKDGTEIVDKNNEHWKRIFIPRFFTTKRCNMCIDATNELADISFGDPWLPEIEVNETIGKSIVISRTNLGESIFKNCFKENGIDFCDLEFNKVIKSQGSINTKKKILLTVLNLRTLINKKNPTYNSHLLKPGLKDYIFGVIVYVHAHLTNREHISTFTSSLIYLESALYTLFKKLRRV